MTAPPETPHPPAPGPSVGLSLHRVTFGFNAALLGTIAGALLPLVVGLVLFLRARSANPDGGDFWAVYGPLLATLAAAGVGALVGTGLGVLAGLRALARPPSPRSKSPRRPRR